MTADALDGFPTVTRQTEPALRPAQRLSAAIETGRQRVVITALVFSLAFAGIGLRLIDLMAFGNDADALATRAVSAAAPVADRADLRDRNGLILATTLPSVSLYADPKLVLDPIEASLRLSKVLPELDQAKLMADLSSDRRFVWLKRGLTPTQQYEINRLGIPGLAFQNEERRYYPAGNLTSHAVGFTNIDAQGIAGLEKSLDDRLQNGESVALSIDLRLQEMVRNELQAAITKFKATAGNVVIMDVKTGEILSMVSLPDFNPYDPTAASQDALFNRNTLGVYEMGSTFKIFNTAMALESGTSTLQTTYDQSPIRVGRFTIRNFRAEPQSGRWSVYEIFRQSMNTGSVHMFEAAGLERQKEFLARLGLTKPSPLELPEVGSPMVPQPWSQVSGMTISYGHGMAVTPVQLITAVAAVVNGGILHPPTLFKRDPSQPVPGKRVLSPELSRIMRALMRVVVVSGTATKADVPGYFVGAKTGSANKAVRGGYNRKAGVTDFVGIFPAYDPKYIVMTMLEDAQAIPGTYGYNTAGWNAAPLGGQIIARMGPMMGVEPKDPNDPAVQQQLALPVGPAAGSAQQQASIEEE
ncbi:peptidoglycan D,D-transpeptidase FtsI family protein [Inquilinus limosus]|uniref:peptidoglycan D,D-transpeptidase FtsI family protein n=1 Tax=Inquilinus limosus TaxID=171674 RepID=UPI00041322E1|nr:penicillin-binding protein 2 [Inquilinus limosus]